MKKMSHSEIKNRHISRRQFLMGLGGKMLLLPPLLSLMSKQAMAQTAASNGVNRLMLFPKKYGIGRGWMDAGLLPSMNNADLAREVAFQDSVIRYTELQRLIDKTGQANPLFDSSFNDIADQINLFMGLDTPRDYTVGHGHASLFGGAIWSNGRQAKDGTNCKSIDVIIEQSPSFKETLQSGRDYPTIRFASRLHADDEGFFFDRDQNLEVVPKRPRQYMSDEGLFQRYFGGGEATISQENREQRKKLIVDNLLEDVNRLKNHRRISTEDKRQLDRYLTEIHELQKNFEMPAQEVQVVSANDFNFEDPVSHGQGYPSGTSMDRLYKNYFRIWKLAFQTDHARIVCFENEHSSDNPYHVDNHHDDDKSSEVHEGRRWFFRHMADFVRDLRDTDDPLNEGKLIDNVGMIWMDEHSDRGPHIGRSMPTVTMGGFGGHINRGLFIDYRRPETHRKRGRVGGHPVKQLMITALQSMGIPSSEYLQFGDGKGFGEFNDASVLEQASRWSQYSIHKNTHNDPLPILTKNS